MQPDKNTLVILSPGFPANEADTTCLPAQQQFVQSLQENFPGLHIIVLSFHYPYVRTTYKWKNVTVVSFNGRNQGKLKRLLLWNRVWRRLKWLKRNHSLLGVFSFWCTECALVGKQFARRHHILHYTWILGQDAKKENKYVRLMRPKAFELVAMSDFLADVFERNHGVRPQYMIPNGVDPRLFSSPPNERMLDVLGAGSLIPLKQYDLFIELIGLAKETYPNIQATICGKGPEESSLRQAIDQLQLSRNISLKGELSHPEVLQWMQRARIFLHPSSYEGFSTVCLEALNAGAHVISFCQPIYDDIPHWHIVNNKEDMLQKLLALLNDAELDHEPVMPYSMKDVSKAVMKLFIP